MQRPVVTPHIASSSWLLLALASACELPEGDGTGTATSFAAGDWAVSSHPCVGNRTDVLWFDDADQGYVGCGSTTVGYGAYVTDDGGSSWSELSNELRAFRVSSIHRDDRLYVAGIDTNGSDRVVAVDEGDGSLTTVFASESQLWNSFHVGTYRRRTDGLQVAESLTGAGLAVAPPGQDWRDGDGWWTEGSSQQLLDLALYDDTFVGVGSTIAQPPMIFLDASTDDAFALRPVVFDEHQGELWGVDAGPGGLVAAGVDQDLDQGLLISGPLDGDGPGDFTVSLVGADFDEATWMRGACRSGELIVGVGEFSQREDGLLLFSDDGGQSWVDRTDELDAPSLHRCRIFADGSVAVTGKDGYFARLN